MRNFIRKHIWLLIFIGGVSYLFVTANPIDYCEKQGRYLSDQEYIDKAIMKQAILLKEGYPDSIDSALKKYKSHVSEEEAKEYYQMLKFYFEKHPKNLVIWHSNRHRYTTNSRMPINVRMSYIPDKKDCEFIMKNNHFEDYSKLTKYETYGYETQWIKQICTGADNLRWHPEDKDAYIPPKEKMIGYSTRFISSSCGDDMFSTGFQRILIDKPPVDIAPTFVEKYLK